MPSKFCILGSKRAINMAISLPECKHFALSYSSIRLYKALNLLLVLLKRGDRARRHFIELAPSRSPRFAMHRAQWLTCSVFNPSALISTSK